MRRTYNVAPGGARKSCSVGKGTRRRMMALFNATNSVTIGLCGAVMIVLGSFIPPLVEAPESPRFILEQAFEV